MCSVPREKCGHISCRLVSPDACRGVAAFASRSSPGEFRAARQTIARRIQGAPSSRGRHVGARGEPYTLLRLQTLCILQMPPETRTSKVASSAARLGATIHNRVSAHLSSSGKHLTIPGGHFRSGLLVLMAGKSRRPIPLIPWHPGPPACQKGAYGTGQVRKILALRCLLRVEVHS